MVEDLSDPDQNCKAECEKKLNFTPKCSNAVFTGFWDWEGWGGESLLSHFNNAK